MIVECALNDQSKLPEHLRRTPPLFEEGLLPLEVGRRYTVYAVAVFAGEPWFYVFDETGIDYPVWQPSAVFFVVDGRMPACWVFGFDAPVGATGRTAVLAFSEWANDISYYGRLVEGESEAVELFERYRSDIEGRVKSQGI